MICVILLLYKILYLVCSRTEIARYVDTVSVKGITIYFILDSCQNTIDNNYLVIVQI